ncbi:MAG TPA: SDR family NAD(P)-dependent oxidoreductase [Dehalococcoidia bacterium]|nr:SDR family NAD(P)-dependent oxidoreductase [Dehalococcoidia bacterium]
MKGGILARFTGKVAVVTGSGRGIGRAEAMQLAAEGAAVIINDIDPDPVSTVVKEIEAAGGKAFGVVADVTKGEEAQKIMDAAVQQFGALDILINNAGLIRDNLIARMTDAQWDLVINISLKGTFNCIRASSRYMMKHGHVGRIVNTSSVAGLFGNVGQANYSAAKAGVVGLTKTVAKEWGPRYNVTCNAVAFGLVDTRMTREKETADTVFGEKVGIPKKIRDEMVEQAAGRIMTPEDAARPVLFLASDDAAFITGQVLNVSAGFFI